MPLPSAPSITSLFPPSLPFLILLFQTHSLGSKYAEHVFVAGAPPHTPLGSPQCCRYLLAGLGGHVHSWRLCSALLAGHQVQLVGKGSIQHSSWVWGSPGHKSILSIFWAKGMCLVTTILVLFVATKTCVNSDYNTLCETSGRAPTDTLGGLHHVYVRKDISSGGSCSHTVTMCHNSCHQTLSVRNVFRCEKVLI